MKNAYFRGFDSPISNCHGGKLCAAFRGFTDKLAAKTAAKSEDLPQKFSDMLKVLVSQASDIILVSLHVNVTVSWPRSGLDSTSSLLDHSR